MFRTFNTRCDSKAIERIHALHFYKHVVSAYWLLNDLSNALRDFLLTIQAKNLVAAHRT